MIHRMSWEARARPRGCGAFVILDEPFWRPKFREPASHLRCAIFEHGAARSRLYARTPAGKIRAFLHGAVAMRGGAPIGHRRHRHYPGHRVPANTQSDDFAGYGSGVEENGA